MDTATVHLEATIGSCALNLSVGVPAGPATVDDFLPLLQILDDKIVASAENDVELQGKCISCQKGCGACCRQLVPLSPADARNITRLVESMALIEFNTDASLPEGSLLRAYHQYALITKKAVCDLQVIESENGKAVVVAHGKSQLSDLAVGDQGVVLQ